MRVYLISLLGIVAFATTAPAQTARSKARLALFDVAFYGQTSNTPESSRSSIPSAWPKPPRGQRRTVSTASLWSAGGR